MLSVTRHTTRMILDFYNTHLTLDALEVSPPDILLSHLLITTGNFEKYLITCHCLPIYIYILQQLEHISGLFPLQIA